MSNPPCLSPSEAGFGTDRGQTIFDPPCLSPGQGGHRQGSTLAWGKHKEASTGSPRVAAPKGAFKRGSQTGRGFSTTAIPKGAPTGLQERFPEGLPENISRFLFPRETSFKRFCFSCLVFPNVFLLYAVHCFRHSMFLVVSVLAAAP